jgi:hypothetical protein
MTVQQLEYLGDGLSVFACGQTLVLDRTRVRPAGAGHDVSFVIAGTDLAPRVRFAAAQLASSTWEEIALVLRNVVGRVVCGQS